MKRMLEQNAMKRDVVDAQSMTFNEDLEFCVSAESDDEEDGDNN
jgi:hypothetical protein